MRAVRRVDAVFFDVGETLVDETRSWGRWADHLGIPRLTFFAVLGAVIERGEDHRRVFDIVRPGIDDAERRRLRQGGRAGADGLDHDDLYPDVLPCLAALRAGGYLLGIAANHPSPAAELLAPLGLAVDVAATSGDWGVEKPSSRFFERIVEEAGVAAERIAYVGDRLDNDVVPAAAAGMMAVFLRRGPWGVIHARRPEAAVGRRLDSLAELPEMLRRA